MKYVYIAIVIFIIIMEFLDPTPPYTKEIIPVHNSVSYNLKQESKFDNIELDLINITYEGHIITLESNNIKENIFYYKGEKI